MITNELLREFNEITGKDFNTFYKMYKPKLIFYLTKYTKCQDLSEDFADDAFTQALLKIKHFDKEKAQIHTWLYKIGENLVIKDFNDKKKMSILSIDKNDDNNLNISNLLSYDYEKKLEEELVLQKKVELINNAIYKLPEKYKNIMVMREIKKMSYVSISEANTKDYNLTICGKTTLPNPNEFLSIKIINKTNAICNITFSFNNGDDDIQFDIKPNEDFIADNVDLPNVNNIVVYSKYDIDVDYKCITNLATIKSQIRAGRELIRNMVKKDFKNIEINGV